MRKEIAWDKQSETSRGALALVNSDFMPLLYASMFTENKVKDSLPCGTEELMSYVP